MMLVYTMIMSVSPPVVGKDKKETGVCKFVVDSDHIFSSGYEY